MGMHAEVWVISKNIERFLTSHGFLSSVYGVF